MQLFYCDTIADEFELSKDESRHLVKSLRKTYGDQIVFTDGIGGKYTCTIIDDNPKRTSLKVEHHELIQASTPKLTVAIAPTKNMDRMEWFLEKATEIGIDRIIPYTSNHSERRVIKEERLEKIIIAAMKQSLKFYKPILEELTTFNELLTRNFSTKKYLAHLDKSNPISFQESYQKGEDLLIVIGPEGDLSEEEVTQATANNFSIVSLGNSRLRTETAAVVACHSFNFMNVK